MTPTTAKPMPAKAKPTMKKSPATSSPMKAPVKAGPTIQLNGKPLNNLTPKADYSQVLKSGNGNISVQTPDGSKYSAKFDSTKGRFLRSYANQIANGSSHDGAWNGAAKNFGGQFNELSD